MIEPTLLFAMALSAHYAKPPFRRAARRESSSTPLRLAAALMWLFLSLASLAATVGALVELWGVLWN